MFKNLLKKSTSSLAAAVDVRSRTSDSHTEGRACVEVFQSHWRQALQIIKKPVDSTNVSSVYTMDEVHSAVSYLEKMCSLLVTEKEENGQQGLCLGYLLTEDILQQVVAWCLNSGVYHDKIKYELLKILETLISQSSQPLLYHKPIIKPLLTLLGSCMFTKRPEIEDHMILLLHQLCICISRNPQYLELFFNVSCSSGQQNFLIFCLLIPYIHREGSLGQQARDALLLIMAASTRNETIGKYIANKSDFCPVLATGLSGLYSSLPHKIRPDNHEDWHRIEKCDYLHLSDVQMIINSLEFCNAVIQVAHELVGQQLIDYIYNGFLIPVMGPALLQSAIEEQVSAIAYLELFIRTISEPALLRAFLRFVLTVRNDDVIILEWLIDRINSSTKLCMVSLSLFKTLVELDCEDIMFTLCFKYLYRCTHVMQSQKRAIKDLDMYGQTADRFLTLQPNCCAEELTEDEQRSLLSHNDGFTMNEYDLLTNLPFNLGFRPSKLVGHSLFGGANPPRLEDYRSSYADYLIEARKTIRCCARATTGWCFPYDGESPPCLAVLEEEPLGRPERSNSVTSQQKYDTPISLDDDVPLINLLISHEETTADQSSYIADVSLLDLSAPPLTASNPLLDLSSLSYSGPPALSPEQNSEQSVDCNQVGVMSASPEASSTPEPSLINTAQQNTCNSETGRSSLQDSIDLPEHGKYENSSEQRHHLSVSNSSAPDKFTSVDSFISYLDDTVTDVIHDPDKSSSSVFEELDLVIDKMQERRQRAMSTQSEREAQSAETEAVKTTAQQEEDTALQTKDESKMKPKLSELRQEEDCVDMEPTLGPFLTTILSKLENMMSNSLSVNLLLTGLLARIACYPHPLLRSLLLNHKMVFQPSIKSLIQVLSSVKYKVDSYSVGVDNFNILLLQARKILLEKEESLNAVSSSESKQRSMSMLTQPGERSLEGHSPSKASPNKKRGSIADFFRREKHQKPLPQPELVREGGGYRFSNKTAPPVMESPESRLAMMNTKKAVYCALVLEEFVKELAALSQEHAVLSDEGYQTD